jgi:chorismate-pyruvate lyase
MLPGHTSSLAELHAALLTADSATSVLEAFFAPPVRAVRLLEIQLPPDTAQLRRLGVVASTEVRHRRVRLFSGESMLSEADLWYIPARLPADMVARLETTSIPFGHVMRPLGLRRQTTEARICKAEESHALEHRAVLTQADGLPVAEVFERYARGLFGPG